MNIIKKALNVAGIRASVQTLRSEVDGLRNKLEKAKREREELAAAPVTQEDVINMLCAYVDRTADEYPRHLADSVARFVMNSKRTVEGPNQPVPLLSAPAHVGIPPSTLSLEKGIFFAFRTQVKDGIKAVIKAAEWPKNARSLAEREAKLPAMDAEIAALCQELDALVSEAAAAGISI